MKTSLTLSLGAVGDVLSFANPVFDAANKMQVRTARYAGAKGSMLLHTRAGKPEAYDFTFDLL
jgi:hypothetical protein